MIARMIRSHASVTTLTRLVTLIAFTFFASCSREPTKPVSSAVVAPSLGTAADFAVLAASTATNTGPTVVTGDLGVSPGTAITGFPPGIVLGTQHSANMEAAQAQADASAAFMTLAGEACDVVFGVPTDLVGMTLVPGTYCFSSSGSLTGEVTLDAGGDPNAVWLFKTGSTFITGSNASVLITNGGQACNVFWQVGSSATIGTGTTFVGTIIALTSITLQTNATLSGRALALNGAVTMDSNVITATACAIAPVVPPTVGKTFSPATIDAGDTSLLTITLSNSDTTAASLTAPFTDTLPTGVLIAGTPTTTCGGTATATATSVTLTGGSIPATGSCTLSVLVTAPSGGSYINTIAAGALQTSNGSNALPAIATLTVLQAAIAPTLGKAFSPATIAAGGTSLLTITLNNADSTVATMTAPLTDTLPTGVLIAGTPATTCGGTVTANTSSVTLAGGAIPANGSCTITVLVTAASGGSYINSIAAGALQTSNGNNAAPAVATLTVPQTATPPTLGKAFDPATIDAGNTSLLTITLTNGDNTVANITAPLTDNLPAGVLIAGAPATTCGGAVTASTTSVTLTGGAIPANGSCTVTVLVSAANGGSFVNSLAAGALQTSNGNNAAPAIATLTVNAPGPAAPPTLGKAFSPATIDAGGTSTLTITLSNPSSSVATLTAPLTDTLPSGMTVSGTPTTTCSGALTFDASSVTLTGGTIPANASCTITVLVTVASGGSYINILPAGALQTSNGNNAAPAITTLTVNAPGVIPPSVGKAFSPATIHAGGTSTLTITLSNPNPSAAVLTAPLTDTLPSGMTVAGTAATTCGGTVSTTSSSVTLNNGVIPASSSCVVTVLVTVAGGGSYINSIAAGALQTNMGNTTSPAIATLTVTAPSVITVNKTFTPSTITAGGTSTVTITITNSGTTDAHLIAPFVDVLPSGVYIVGGKSTDCGGTVTAEHGGSTITLTGGTLPAMSSVTVTVIVTAALAGSYFNTIPAGAVQTDQGTNASPAVATLTVIAATTVPVLEKHFTPATIYVGEVSTLTITLSNSDSSAAHLTAPLVDHLPHGMTVAGVATTSCGGTVTAYLGSSEVTLNGGSIPAHGSCTVCVDVTTSCEGSYCNTIDVCELQTDHGSNASPAQATLTVHAY